MLKNLALLVVALMMLSACGNQAAKIDHSDPESVTRAMVTALRDNDLETLAKVYHAEHEDGVRQSTLAYLNGEIDVEQWYFYGDQSEIDKYTSNWNGYLKGPKYVGYFLIQENLSSDFMILYAFTKPDSYNEIAVAVLNRYDEGWFIDHITMEDQDEFDARPRSEEEMRVLEEM